MPRRQEEGSSSSSEAGTGEIVAEGEDRQGRHGEEAARVEVAATASGNNLATAATATTAVATAGATTL